MRASFYELAGPTSGSRFVRGLAGAEGGSHQRLVGQVARVALGRRSKMRSAAYLRAMLATMSNPGDWTVHAAGRPETSCDAPFANPSQLALYEATKALSVALQSACCVCGSVQVSVQLPSGAPGE